MNNQSNNTEARHENTSEYKVLFRPKYLTFDNSQILLKESELQIIPRFEDFP
jgi:hypothetical protein